MHAFFCDQFVLPLPPHHSFPMAKYRLLRERLVQEAVLDTRQLAEPPAVAWQDVALAHGVDYVASVRDGTLSREDQRRIGFPWSPALVERSRRSIGGTLEAARAALSDGVAVNLAGGTHHAFRDRGEGYCVFNDTAVAAQVLLRDGLIRRAAVVDCDVHQGNGTAAIFQNDPRVFTFSIHGARNFPLHKERSDLDVALADGTGDTEYLAALERHLGKVLSDRPDLVFFVSGADPYEGDRFGRLRLSLEGLRRRDALVLGACRARGVPVAISMAGGYARDLETIVTIHANTVRVASGLA